MLASHVSQIGRRSSVPDDGNKRASDCQTEQSSQSLGKFSLDKRWQRCMLREASQCKRMVTVRELARSQGFPDDFLFEAVDGKVRTVSLNIIRHMSTISEWNRRCID